MDPVACPGEVLASGLPVGLCHGCALFDQRRPLPDPWVYAAVVWVESARRVGYECINHRPRTEDSDTVWALLASAG